MTLYPSGKVEVVFQHLANRTPFGDVALREQFRQRLNQLPDVNIAAAKLALRPGFPISILADSTTTTALVEHLQWFYEQAHLYDRPDETLAALQ